MKKTKTKTNYFLNTTSFDSVYQYYIMENHTKLECYSYFNTTERVFRAFLEYYNVKKPRKLVKQLADNTKKMRYGDKNYNNREKCIKTCLERYGATSPLGSYKIWQKTYASTIAKHGATGFAARSADERIALAKYANSIMWDMYHSDIEFAKAYQNQMNITKIKNKSFNSSNKEKELYILLCKKYGKDNVISQYRDNRYPFNCDFYIKSEDLFIELNAHWTHGPHPFNKEDSADLALLASWQEKAKTSKFYENAIETWVTRDILKLNYLINNNLKFILLYNTIRVTIDDYKH